MKQIKNKASGKGTKYLTQESKAAGLQATTHTLQGLWIYWQEKKNL